jgi:hypothetical protein
MTLSVINTLYNSLCTQPLYALPVHVSHNSVDSSDSVFNAFCPQDLTQDDKLMTS